MLKDFFIWLAGQASYKSRVSYHDAEYFSLTAKDERIAHTAREARVPSLDEVIKTIEAMPHATAIEKRDRALIAFALITGARISALRTLRLKHVEWDRGRVLQDAREVATKNSKTIITPFYPISDEAKTIVGDWLSYLRDELGREDDDALFPRVKMAVGQSGGFEVMGLEREPYKSDGPIRDIFKNAFATAGVPNYNPHSFRKLIANIGASGHLSPAELKAWSMGLGHEHLGTMMQSYVTITPAEQERLRHDNATANANYASATSARNGIGVTASVAIRAFDAAAGEDAKMA